MNMKKIRKGQQGTTLIEFMVAVAVGLILILAALLPMLAASLILLWIVERLLLPRLPRAARWLGVAAKAPARL